METGKRNGCLIVLACVLLVGLLLAGSVIYLLLTEEPTPAGLSVIVESVSEDENSSLTIYNVGEPEWSFGNAHCRFQLKRWGMVRYEYSFDVANDGGYARPDNFTIRWDEEKATVTVSADEAPTKDYELWLDGSVTVSQP